MGNKRRHERVTINVSADIISSSSVRVINISLSGALIEYDDRLEIGKGIRVAVIVEGQPVVLNGQIVRSTIARTEKNARGEMAPVYQAGVNFERQLTQAEYEILFRLVQ